MTESVNQGNFFERLINNQKLLAGSGLFMFFLGLIAWFMAMAATDVTDERMKATLSSVILLAMGYPMLLYVGSQRKLKEVGDRLQRLEQAAGISSQSTSKTTDS